MCMPGTPQCNIAGSLTASLPLLVHLPPSATMTASQSNWRRSSGSREPSFSGPPSSGDRFIVEMGGSVMPYTASGLAMAAFNNDLQRSHGGEVFTTQDEPVRHHQKLRWTYVEERGGGPPKSSCSIVLDLTGRA